MNSSSLKWSSALLFLCLTGLFAIAQEGPRPGNRDRDQEDGPPPRQERGRGERRPALNPPPPEALRYIEALRGYLEVVERFAHLSHDPGAVGVAAVIQAKEILEPRGIEAAVAYFNKILPEVKNDAVQRTIRLQLAELYKKARQDDKALEQLQILMTTAPASTPAANPAPPPAPAH